jgi:putative NIF3 family GTP cyclohydrolase 1 type 2
MTRSQNIDALAVAIRKLIEALIAGDRGAIGSHQNLTDAQTGLRDALRAALGLKTEERATND